MRLGKARAVEWVPLEWSGCPGRPLRGPGVSKHQEMSIAVAKNWGNLGVYFEQTHTFNVKTRRHIT